MADDPAIGDEPKHDLDTRGPDSMTNLHDYRARRRREGTRT